MKNINNLKFKDVLAGFILILALLLVYFGEDLVYKIKDSDTKVEESKKVSQDIAKLLNSLDTISLDISIFNTPHLQNLKQLPQFPLDANNPFNFGKLNPFTGGSINLNQTVAATGTVVGGVQYAAQRDPGQASVRSVNVNNNIRR
jgi:predicted PurR-regulated permease PerM